MLDLNQSFIPFLMNPMMVCLKFTHLTPLQSLFMIFDGQKRILLGAICMLSEPRRKILSQWPEMGNKDREQHLRDIRLNYKT